MSQFYVTLVKELAGHYIIAFSPDEASLRIYLIQNYGRLWCSIYTEPPKGTLIGQTIIIPQEFN